MFRSGIRLVSVMPPTCNPKICSETKPFSRLQHEIENKQTFSKDVISLDQDSYESLVKEMRLPLRSVHTTRVVGPFFWWEYDPDAEDPCFRKASLNSSSSVN